MQSSAAGKAQHKPSGPAPRGPQSVNRTSFSQSMVLRRLAANWYLLARASGKASLYIFNLTGEPGETKRSDPDWDALKAASAKEQIPSPPFPVASSALTSSQSCFLLLLFLHVSLVSLMFVPHEWTCWFILKSDGKVTWYSEL